jgi:orotate phosphoribosyltransferase
MSAERTERFFELCIELGVLKFGHFTLKSGRKSPYFFNSGLFNTGSALARLADFYAQTIVDSRLVFDGLFGPAYKGIPLVSAVAIALVTRHGRDVPFSFNRKVAKTYGEGGSVIGAPLKGRILIVDDVITAGTAIGESVELIRAAKAEPAAVIIALDRQERGTDERSAVQEVHERFGLGVISVANLADLLRYVASRPEYDGIAGEIDAYHLEYGVASKADRD